MNFEYEFHHVLKDNTSGSSSILNQLINILINYFSQNPLCHTNEIQEIAYKLSENFPSFAVIQHFTKEFKYYIKQDKKIKNDEILKFLDEYKNKWRDVNIRIAQNLLSKVHISNKTILLHSNSYSIHSVFSEIKNNNYQVKVIQTISYPAKEGIKQAEILSDFGFHITLISDSIIENNICT